MVKGLTNSVFPHWSSTKPSWELLGETLAHNRSAARASTIQQGWYSLRAYTPLLWPSPPRFHATHLNVNALRKFPVTKHALYPKLSPANLLKEYFFHAISLHMSQCFLSTILGYTEGPRFLRSFPYPSLYILHGRRGSNTYKTARSMWSFRFFLPVKQMLESRHCRDGYQEEEQPEQGWYSCSIRGIHSSYSRVKISEPWVWAFMQIKW